MTNPRPLEVERRKWRPQLVWVVPVIAVILGVFLLIRASESKGPRIVINFPSAEGLQVGKTLVKFRSVPIGRVSGIVLSEAQDSVDVTVDLDRAGRNAATKGSEFWVQHPRIGLDSGAGMDSLLGGAFIGVQMGRSGAYQDRFQGLDAQPALPHGPNGRQVILHADDLGSIAQGAPIYFRRVQVGHVTQTGLESAGSGARIVAFVDAPNDRLISPRTRFWNASGVDLSLNADGLQVRTQSLVSVLAGGIAFEDLPEEFTAVDIDQATERVLYRDRNAAFAPTSGAAHLVRMRFHHTLRGLNVGAPVELVGVNIGHVSAVDLEFAPREQSFTVVVTAVLYPRLMGRAYETLLAEGTAESDVRMSELVGRLVGRGLRVQPRIGSLLTGQLYLAMDFLPTAKAVHFDAQLRPLELPAVESTTGELELRVASIAQKLDQLPLSRIAEHLDGDLTTLHEVLTHTDRDLLPELAESATQARATLAAVEQTLAADSPLKLRLDRTLADTDGALQEVHALADYLYRHPNALIFGRQKPGNREVDSKP